MEEKKFSVVQVLEMDQEKLGSLMLPVWMGETWEQIRGVINDIQAVLDAIRQDQEKRAKEKAEGSGMDDV